MQRLLLCVSLLLPILWSAGGCSHSTDKSNEPIERLDAPLLTQIRPGILVKGTLIVVGSDSSFIPDESGTSRLQFRGELDGVGTVVSLPARFVDYNRMEVDWPGGKEAGMPSDKGKFVGSVRLDVDSWLDNQRHFSPDLRVELQVVDQLQPQLDAVASEDVGYINDLVEVDGDGFLLGGNEGNTKAIVEGTYSPEGGIPIAVEPVEIACATVEGTKEAEKRKHVAFPFSPRIAGIHPGSFTGTVRLRNDSADGVGSEETDSLPFSWKIGLSHVTRLSAIDPASKVKRPAGPVNLGQYLIVEGSGFVGGDPERATTAVEFSGTLTLDDGSKINLTTGQLVLVPKFVTGQELHYEVSDHDQLNALMKTAGKDIRFNAATFEGNVVPTISIPGDQQVGQVLAGGGFREVRFSPPKQVFWVDFLPQYVESLRHFGLRAAEEEIRQRVFDVAARDYAGVNVEFVAEPPIGFAQFGRIQIQGPDPSLGEGFGLDNTNGKDSCNDTLADTIGGITAKSSANDRLAYGGVFVENFFLFSSDPGVFARKSESLEEPVFDQIFDPFRPDRGGIPVSAEDKRAGIPSMDPSSLSAAGCVAEDRPHQIACAIWTLGSLIGTTMTHEAGHTLGLAKPWLLGDPHDPDDGIPGRLMNAGSFRSFRERVEMGEGPSRFCELEYKYLRWILPTTDPEPAVVRPDCTYDFELDESKCGTKRDP